MTLRRTCRRTPARLVFILLVLLTALCWYLLISPSDNASNEGPATYSSPEQCPHNISFKGTFKQNLQKLQNNEFNASLPWLLRFDKRKPPARVATFLPVFVTAASRTWFVRSQVVVKNIIDRLMPAHKDLKLIYFDLDLTDAQSDIMKKHCKCEVRRLPYKLLPAHAQKFHNYAFKPIIINLLYKEFGNVWWVDSSVRFLTSDLDLPLKYLKENGILFFTYGQEISIAQHTDIRMFSYYNEDPCLYTNFGEIEAGFIAFRKSVVAEVVLRQWLACALDENCISPANATKYCSEFDRSILIGQCHRYDQSALGIILRRLYHKRNHYPLVETPFRIHDIHRKEDIPFFGIA